MKRITFIVVGFVMAVALLVAATSQRADAHFADFPSYDFGSLGWFGGNAGLEGALDVGWTTGFVGSVSNRLPIDSGSPYGHGVGLLTFTTGAYAGTGGSWNFLSGGSFSLVGGVSRLGLDSTTTLMHGTLSSVSIDVRPLAGGLFYDTVSGSFAGILDDVLARHYGLPSTSVSGFMSFSFLVDIPISPSDGFSFSSADSPTGGGSPTGLGSPTGVGMDVPTNPVPVPSALLLFAPGLVGLAAIRRRFRKEAPYYGE